MVEKAVVDREGGGSDKKAKKDESVVERGEGESRKQEKSERGDKE